MARAMGTYNPNMRVFNSFVRLQRNWDLERCALRTAIVQHRRRGSVPALQSVSSPAPAFRRIRSNSIGTRPIGDVPFDREFARLLHANVGSENDEPSTSADASGKLVKLVKFETCCSL